MRCGRTRPSRSLSSCSWVVVWTELLDELERRAHLARVACDTREHLGGAGDLLAAGGRLLCYRRDLLHGADDLVRGALLLLSGHRDLLRSHGRLLDHLEDLIERVAGDVRQIDALAHLLELLLGGDDLSLIHISEPTRLGMI